METQLHILRDQSVQNDLCFKIHLVDFNFQTHKTKTPSEKH